MKPRILWISEASYLRTGYATYTREVLSRLHSTGKYHLVELASYASPDDPRINSVPWDIYPIMPSERDKQAYEKYQRVPTAQFGSQIFEKACLDVKPTIVCSIKDIWMDEYISTSPFRSCFNWVWMPTVDAMSNNPQWLSLYADADALFTYQDWSHQLLKQQCGDSVNLLGSAPPCASQVFRHIPNREDMKAQLGLKGKKIIGTVMRNQRRKLYPQLFKAFRQFLDKTGRNDVLLYCHTSYPDAGWNIPKLILEYNLSSKVLITYTCSHRDEHGNLDCNQAYPAFFSDALMYCPKCGRPTAHISSVQTGVSDEILCRIYNIMDYYVQYATCLTPNQQILTNQGWKQIKDIQIGDIVWTHKHRYKEVTQLFKNKSNNIKKISVHGDYETLEITGNHPIYCITNQNNNKSLIEHIENLIRNKKSLPQPQFLPINQLQNGDLIANAINDTVKDIKKIDLLKYLQNKKVRFNKNQISIASSTQFYDRFVDVNNDFCKFLGLYIADGSYNKNIQICCNQDEDKNIKFSIKVLSNILGKTPTINKYLNRNAVDIIGHSVIHSLLFQTFGKLENKALPDWTLYLPLKKQKSILVGMFMGDGHYNLSRNTSTYVTISEELANQLKFILRRLRIYYNCHIEHKTNDKDQKNRKIQYRFEVPGDIANNKFIFKRNSTRSLYIDNYFYLQVKEVKHINYNDYVYNFEVQEDNSYTGKIGNLHNCEGFGMPVVESAACGTPSFATDYSAMEDTIRKVQGVPLKVLTLDREVETDRWMAIPDNEFFIDQLTKYLNMSQEEYEQLRYQTRKAFELNYNWDVTATKWMNHFDSIDINKYEEAWKKEPRILKPDNQIPRNISNQQFARWLITNVLREPERLGSFMEARLIRDLNYKFSTLVMGGMYFNELSVTSNRPNFQPFDREIAYKHMVDLCNRRNYWENLRWRSIQ